MSDQGVSDEKKSFSEKEYVEKVQKMIRRLYVNAALDLALRYDGEKLFGAKALLSRRIANLLKKKGIHVTEEYVYSVLKNS